MSANSFGHLFRFTSFGESHGVAIGGIIEGMPAGVEFNETLLKKNMQRRRPGQNALVSARNEDDEVEILSGIFEGLSLGTPIGFLIRNKDARSSDYSKKTQRVGHADDLWREKFGHSDHRGGGRASGRETATRVVAGSFAQMLAQKMFPEVEVIGAVTQIANFKLARESILSLNQNKVEESLARFPIEKSQQSELEKMLLEAKISGESFGGRASVIVKNLPRGLGQPLFQKFKSNLAQAMLSIGATCGFEFGEGFEAAAKKGTDFHSLESSQKVYGGIRGGLTTGEALVFDVAFKPTSTLGKMATSGRHDPCIVPRAVPVCEAMTWIVIADQLLWQRLDRI